MEIATTEPRLQFHSGASLDGRLAGRGGQPLHCHAALCLHPQHFPNSPRRPDFPSTLLRADEISTSTTIHRFTHS